MTQILCFIGIVLASSVLTFVFFVVVRYVPIIERNAFNVPRFEIPETPRVPAGLRPEKITLFAESGPVEAHYIAARKPAKALVIFCHETGADWRSWTKHAYYLPDHGTDVLALSYEQNGGAFQWPSERELATVRTAVRWASRNRPDYRIALFGVSKGSVLAAAASRDARVHAVVLDGAFSSLETLTDYVSRWAGIYVPSEEIARRIPIAGYAFLSRIALLYAGLRRGERFLSIEPFARGLTKPVFLIHAAKDSYVRLDAAQKIRGLMGAKADLWVVPDADHSESVVIQPENYRQKISNFLAENLV